MSSTENIPVGKHLKIEIPRPDGSTSVHLGRFLCATIHEVVVDHHSWVSQTGRLHLFLAGKPDENYEVEVSPPEAVTRLPRWGAIVQDWMHPLPEQSM